MRLVDSWRLLLHGCVTAAGAWGLHSPPQVIVEASDPRFVVAWALLLTAGGAMSLWAVVSGWLLPHLAGLGLEVVGVATFSLAALEARGSDATTAVLIFAAFAVGLLDGGLRILRAARVRRAGRG